MKINQLLESLQLGDWHAHDIPRSSATATHKLSPEQLGGSAPDSATTCLFSAYVWPTTKKSLVKNTVNFRNPFWSAMSSECPS